MADPAGQISSQTDSLAPWAEPYVTKMLGRGEALASAPYQEFQGPLTAGASQLQNTAFSGLGSLTPPANMGAYTPQSFTGAGYAPPTAQQAVGGQTAFSNPFMSGMGGQGQGQGQGPYDMLRRYTGPSTQEEADQIQAGGTKTVTNPATGETMQVMANDPRLEGLSGEALVNTVFQTNIPQDMRNQRLPQTQPAPQSIVQQYMNPYLEGALQPQYDAADRQSQIQQLAMQSQYGKAGAYGGSRQAVAGAELARGLLDRKAGITGTGYQNAFDQAQKQFNTEQRLQMDAQGEANRYGLDALEAQRAGGAEQRAIEDQGIAADMGQFQEERGDPYKKVQYMQSLLQGLPVEALSREFVEPSDLANILSYAGSGAGILGDLFGKDKPFKLPSWLGGK